EADGARVAVLARAETRRAAAEHLGPRLQLHMDLEAYDRLPRACNRAHAGTSPRSLVGTPSKPIACSSAWPARKSVFSPNCGPISCRPTGRPSESPDGMLSPGSPARQEGIVIRSHAYIASGSLALSPIGNATVGEVGVAIASKRSSASRCS